MNKFILEIMKKLEKLNLQDLTIKRYIINFSNLYEAYVKKSLTTCKDLVFLRDFLDINEIIKEKPLKIMLQYYSSIITILKLYPFKENKEPTLFYIEEYKKISDELKKDKIYEEKQECLKIINEKFQQLKFEVEGIIDEVVLDKDDYNLLLNFIILCFFIYIKPRTHKELINLKISKNKENLSPFYNYFIIETNELIFKDEIIKIEKEFAIFLKKFIYKHHRTFDFKEKDIFHLFINNTGRELRTETNFTKRLNTLFDNKISTTKLKNCFYE